jgi:hypothetical protein
MIELKNDALVFSFPEVHPDAVLSVQFQRTLRIPDDGRTYPLPAGLARFPMRHVDDFADRVPPDWLEHGGVLLQMYQAEALWINLHSNGYPMALKVATGKIDAVSGGEFSEGLNRTPQDYLVVPDQPWLDGYCIDEGVVRQFVAMPLGSGYTTEEQLTGRAQHGGLQLVACPIRSEVWEAMKRRKAARAEIVACYEMAPSFQASMGLAPGGRMRQKIYPDRRRPTDWALRHRSRCFVHLANSHVWRSITGEEAPATPVTPAEYERQGIPWFDYYEERYSTVPRSDRLAGVESVVNRAKRLGHPPLIGNDSVDPKLIVELRRGLAPEEVRQGEF